MSRRKSVKKKIKYLSQVVLINDLSFALGIDAVIHWLHGFDLLSSLFELPAISAIYQVTLVGRSQYKMKLAVSSYP
jgi:hypothetical protein